MLESFAPDSRALVVGASRGIGLEFVRQLARESCFATVHAACRDPQRAEALADIAGTSPHVQPVAIDIASEDSIEAACRAVSQASPQLHLVVNAAGMLHDASRDVEPERRLTSVKSESLARAFAINGAGPLLLARYLEPALSHGGRAVFASLSARVGSIADNRLGGWYAYRMSKAAQNMALRTLSIEWVRQRKNIAVVALHPGTTDTDLSKPFQRNVPPEKLFTPERSVRQLLKIIDDITPAESGRFIAWDGSAIPW
ncbi:MAG TPA: SDR family NAD(P)-dependent oxidoreductase [Steroidobacteraceae bacterium]|nr:SDR family NAD(P)-dependent oxidoreductase [Steroidobacteraceae bacterium]